MPVVASITEFQTALPPMRAIVGLDLGTKTIGVAISDVMRMIATPVTTIKRSKMSSDLDALGQIFREKTAVGIVLGLPLEMDGLPGTRAQATRAFAHNLLKVHDLPTLFWDERLSTVAVERTLIGEADLTRKKRARVVDRAAAAFILQGVLDALAYNKGTSDDY